ncbi:hypothetical protein AVEN_259023-1, partial [Araneus ventricosus]
MTRTTLELAPLSPNFRATLTEGRLATTHDLACNSPHTRRIFSGIGFRTSDPPVQTLPLGHRGLMIGVVSMGLPYPKDLKHSEIENGSLFSNSTEDAAFNETESVATDEVSGRIVEETTSHLILEKTTKNLEVTAIESK